MALSVATICVNTTTLFLTHFFLCPAALTPLSIFIYIYIIIDINPERSGNAAMKVSVSLKTCSRISLIPGTLASTHLSALFRSLNYDKTETCPSCLRLGFISLYPRCTILVHFVPHFGACGMDSRSPITFLHRLVRMAGINGATGALNGVMTAQITLFLVLITPFHPALIPSSYHSHHPHSHYLSPPLRTVGQ